MISGKATTNQKIIYPRFGFLHPNGFTDFITFTPLTIKKAMNKYIGILSLLLGWLTTVFAQLIPTPDQFLGYPLGSKFTRHHALVGYCKTIAAKSPTTVKLEPYGVTNEGRELLLAFVSSPENIGRLEEIRRNNLRLAGAMKDSSPPPISQMPAIVWLSYNVHGNEPASSEAALQTLYTLANAATDSLKKWLSNTVVVIDPCLNPDGRDRYVNWYNSVVGVHYDPNPLSREHQEPWPQGRSNHYNFDLNRDWAWQTQAETKARMAVYNQWMPQIHVDYHEQGYNEPYYFAPAAEPFHEVITPFQRSFQNLIGKNHARYFDANGWLYFTKERFDLFYPSYGDTYPIYTGAVGMTYEQGGIKGGLGIKTDEGDTLTLADRIQHHFTTGLSTIETVSNHLQELMSAYKQFFEDSRAAKKLSFKTYILTSDQPDKLKAVEKLLAANGITYGSLSNNSNYKGYNYFSQKEETVTLKKYHTAVSMLQTRSVLATVLLEPKGNLSDSNTYDITAWSLPYAYGVEAYALKDVMPVHVIEKQEPTTIITSLIPQSNYGYLIKYNCFTSAKVLAHLLNKSVKLRVASKPFSYANETYERGTLIVLNKGNQVNLTRILAEAVAESHITINAVASGLMDKGVDLGSPENHLINAPSVALITGDQTSSLNVGEIWNFFEQQLHYPITMLNADALLKQNLKSFTTIIVPDGSYKIWNDKAIADKIKEYVQNGGKIIAIENALQFLATTDWGIKNKENKKAEKDAVDSQENNPNNIKRFADRERSELASMVPGAIYKLDLDNTHPLGFGYASTYYSLRQDDNIYQYLKEGWNVGTIKKDGYTVGFSGSKVKSKVIDGLVMGVQEMGNGSIVYLNDNPLFRLFWENGKLLFSNAVFLVGQ